VRKLRGVGLIIFLVLCLPTGLAGQSPADLPDGAGDALLKRIWDGVQEAQKKYTTGRGTITETRTSSLLARPLVFHGKFFASGTTKFSLEYSAPEPVRVVYSGDYLNVTTGKQRSTTEVIKIGQHVRRTQVYFSRENSLANLKKSFTISVRETKTGYEMKLAPRAERFKRRVNYVVVTLSKPEFLLRSLEVDGTSGVNSRFDIQLEALNAPIGDEIFKVYRP
jgi:outer membrane lipoprotein-sorting protein